MKTLRTDGFAGLERGYVATTCMRAVGLPFYFGTYNASKRALGVSDASPKGEPVAHRLPKIMVAGGIAGTFFWGVSFPLDFLKTRLQTQPEGSARVGLLKLVRRNIELAQAPRGPSCRASSPSRLSRDNT